MIKYEHNTLVLDSSHTKEDQKAVNDFVNFRVTQEIEKIAKILGISLDELEKKENNELRKI